MNVGGFISVSVMAIILVGVLGVLGVSGYLYFHQAALPQAVGNQPPEALTSPSLTSSTAVGSVTSSAAVSTSGPLPTTSTKTTRIATATTSTLRSPNGCPLTPITLSFISPKDGSTVSGTVKIEVVPSNNGGITDVEFLSNDQRGQIDPNGHIGAVTKGPYVIMWDTSKVYNGRHDLYAFGYFPALCANGHISVNVNSDVPLPPPPSQDQLISWSDASGLIDSCRVTSLAYNTCLGKTWLDVKTKDRSEPIRVSDVPSESVSNSVVQQAFPLCGSIPISHYYPQCTPP